MTEELGKYVNVSKINKTKGKYVTKEGEKRKEEGRERETRLYRETKSKNIDGKEREAKLYIKTKSLKNIDGKRNYFK